MKPGKVSRSGKVRKSGKRLVSLQQKGIKITGKWKPVSLDPSFFTAGKMDEMICFEELSGYKLVKSSKELTARSGKRKRGAGEEDLEPEDSKEHFAKGKKNKKRKKKLEAKKAKEETEDEMEDVFLGREDEEEYHQDTVEGEADTDVDTDADTEPSVEPMAVQAPKKKKKRPKKKKKQPAETREEPVTAKSSKRTKNWAAGVLSGAATKDADVSAWKDLCVPPPVLQALSYLGFSAPTPIQALALPSAIRDKMDILGAAETGSGKTLAFAIPMIHSILEWRKMRESGVTEEEEEKEEETSDQEEPEEEEEEPPELVAIDQEEDNLDNEEDEDDDDDESSALGCVKVVEDVDINFNPVTSETSCNMRPLLGLVVTPTRELAVQVKHHIDAVAKFSGIRTAIVVGGMAPQKQERLLNRGPEIVIATPGRLWEMIREEHPHLSNLKKLRCLVIDEADRMVEKGHYAELTQLLEMLSDTHYNPKRQTFVFSATLTLIHQAPSRLLQKKNFRRMDKDSKLESLMHKVGMKGKPKVIDLTRKQATVETLTETRIHCATDEKDFYLYYFLLQYPGRTMVFANSIDCIKRLTCLLTILEFNPLQLHANMHQKQRLKNLERFAERESCVLLTTDVAARGLDIPNIQHVLHYQVPRTSETYVHRSGRTARASSDGLTLLLIGPDDVVNYRKIFRTLEKNDELPFFPVESKCMNGIKERVGLARQIEKAEYFHSKTKQQNSWIQQAAEALEMEIDDDLLGGNADEEEDRSKQKALKFLKKQLKRLLSQPVFRNIMKTRYPTKSGQLTLPDLPGARSESALHTLSNQHTKKQKPRP
ncbi:ATP-dependent RNA helicase DDX24 isoform X2 [Rana temporaria]|uniref:ATP-dependent RNA helicase DDX24 isoform X2 n=1 Tax=Rana temporaria TaxID=8407 RepID=UPI001AAD8CC3|nr:ATP-dependent RNA helicase DDX24 isoform X2 [Rana temporaria]